MEGEPAAAEAEPAAAEARLWVGEGFILWRLPTSGFWRFSLEGPSAFIHDTYAITVDEHWEEQGDTRFLLTGHLSP